MKRVEHEYVYGEGDQEERDLFVVFGGFYFIF
jgi:hypothetical protein